MPTPHLTLRVSHPMRGVIALMTVIVIGALVVIIGVSAAFVGQGDTSASGQMDGERVVRLLATACVDEALYRLKLNSAYVGGTVPVGANSCTAAVSGIGTARTIVVSATLSGHTKTVTVNAVLRQNALATARAWRIDSWTEGNPP